MKSFYLKKIKVLNINFGPHQTAAHGVLRLIILLFYGFFLFGILNSLNNLQNIELPVELLEVNFNNIETPSVTVVDEITLVGKSWSYFMVNGLAITTVIIVAGPVFFPLTSSAVVSAATWVRVG